jgi:hypothetical protein
LTLRLLPNECATIKSHLSPAITHLLTSSDFSVLFHHLAHLGGDSDRIHTGDISSAVFVSSANLTMEVAIFTSHRAYDQISKDSSISALVCLTCGASQERSEDDFAGLTLWRTELPLGTFGRGLCDRALHTDTKGQNVGEAKLGTHSLRVAD